MKITLISLFLITASQCMYAGDVRSPKSRGAHHHNLKEKDARKFQLRQLREQQRKEYLGIAAATKSTSVQDSRLISRERRGKN